MSRLLKNASPVDWIVPPTVSVFDGLKVPIPTLPALASVIRAYLLVKVPDTEPPSI